MWPEVVASTTIITFVIHTPVGLKPSQRNCDVGVVVKSTPSSSVAFVVGCEVLREAHREV